MTTGASSKRSLLKFYVLVFALAVPFWLVGAVVEVEGLPMDLPVSVLMLVCPITAAWILVRRDEGPGGMRRLMKRVFDYRKITRRIWYVPMILLMPITLLLTYWMMRLTGVASPEPSTALAEAPILVVAYFIAAVGEEALDDAEKIEDRPDVILGEAAQITADLVVVEPRHLARSKTGS